MKHLRITLYTLGGTLICAAPLAAFFVAWFPAVLIAGSVVVILGGFVHALESDGCGYDETVFGRESVAFDRIIQYGGIE